MIVCFMSHTQVCFLSLLAVLGPIMDAEDGTLMSFLQGKHAIHCTIFFPPPTSFVPPHSDNLGSVVGIQGFVLFYFICLLSIILTFHITEIITHLSSFFLLVSFTIIPLSFRNDTTNGKIYFYSLLVIHCI